MAHPKLTAAVNRSVLTLSAAALITGPLAGAAFAQSVEDDPVGDLTCEEATKTEDEALIATFCPKEEPSEEAPPPSSEDDVTKTTESTVKQVEDTVAPKQEEDGGGGDTGGGGGGEGGDTDNTTGPLLKSPSKDGAGPGTDVEGSGGRFTEVKEGGQRSGNNRGANAVNARARSAGPGYSYNADGPFLPGMQSQSSLILQPFAAPLVSMPPVYELPQVAQELFGTATGATTVDDPLVAGPATTGSTATAASPYSPASYSATSADPTGWVAATATGLIMLVGAAHALNGGRTPRRERG